MPHILVIQSPEQRSMFIGLRGKKALEKYITMADTHGWAWRYHDGTGWADGSPDAYRQIQSLTETCMATCVY